MNSILPFCKHIIAGMLAFGTDIICLRKMLVQSILFCQVVYTLLPSSGIEEMGQTTSNMVLGKLGSVWESTISLLDSSPIVHFRKFREQREQQLTVKICFVLMENSIGPSHLFENNYLMPLCKAVKNQMRPHVTTQ